MAQMFFSDLKECPICGHDEFYTNVPVNGMRRQSERYDGKEADTRKDNDYLYVRKTCGRAYCKKCQALLGNKFTNELSSSLEREIKRRNKKK